MSSSQDVSVVGHAVERQVPAAQRRVGVGSVVQQQGDHVGVPRGRRVEQEAAGLRVTPHTGSCQINTYIG